MNGFRYFDTRKRRKPYGFVFLRDELVEYGQPFCEMRLRNIRAAGDSLSLPALLVMDGIYGLGWPANPAREHYFRRMATAAASQFPSRVQLH